MHCVKYVIDFKYGNFLFCLMLSSTAWDTNMVMKLHECL